MSSFYVVGFSTNEVANGKQTAIIQYFGSGELNKQLAKETKGVLIYSRRKPDEKDKYKDYFGIYYVKDTVFPLIKDKFRLSMIDTIDESEIPPESAVIIRL